MGKDKRGLLKNITSVGFIQVANYVFPMITIPIVARIIGPDKLGVINFNASFVAYFTLLIGFGFDLTATRKVAADPGNEAKRNQVFSEVVTSQGLLFLLSLAIFSIALYTMPELKEEKVVAVFTFLTCLATLFTQNWLFQAMQDLPKIAILNVISKVIFTVSVLVLIQTREDYIWQPLVLSLSQVLVAGLSFVWAVKKYSLKYNFVNPSSCLKLLWDEKTFFFSMCVISLYTNTNVIMLGLFQDAAQVGFYTSGQKLIAIIQSIITIPLAQAVYPFIGKAFGESYDKGIRVAQRLLPIVLLFTFLAGLIILIGAPYFIAFFYGKMYEPAVIVCRILAFVPMFIALGTVTGIHVMLNLNLDKIFFKAICIGAVSGLIFNLFLVNWLGYIGSAFSWAITEFIANTLLYFLLRREGIDIINKSYFKFSFYLKSKAIHRI